MTGGLPGLDGKRRDSVDVSAACRLRSVPNALDYERRMAQTWLWSSMTSGKVLNLFFGNMLNNRPIILAGGLGSPSHRVARRDGALGQFWDRTSSKTVQTQFQSSLGPVL